MDSLSSTPAQGSPSADAGLLALFTRFVSLSRPDVTTPAECHEYTRLLIDIPEQIRRLIVFAEIGTDALLEKTPKN